MVRMVETANLSRCMIDKLARGKPGPKINVNVNHAFSCRIGATNCPLPVRRLAAHTNVSGMLGPRTNVIL